MFFASDDMKYTLPFTANNMDVDTPLFVEHPEPMFHFRVSERVFNRFCYC